MKRCVSTDVGTWTNWLTFEPDPDYSPHAGTGLLYPISYKRCYAEFYVGKTPRIRICGPPLQRGVVLKWFYSPSRRNTFVGGTCALPCAFLVIACDTWEWNALSVAVLWSAGSSRLHEQFVVQLDRGQRWSVCPDVLLCVPMSCCVPVSLQSDEIVSLQNSEQRDNYCQVHAILYPKSLNKSEYLNTKVCLTLVY